MSWRVLPLPPCFPALLGARMLPTRTCCLHTWQQQGEFRLASSTGLLPAAARLGLRVPGGEASRMLRPNDCVFEQSHQLQARSKGAHKNAAMALLAMRGDMQSDVADAEEDQRKMSRQREEEVTATGAVGAASFLMLTTEHLTPLLLFHEGKRSLLCMQSASVACGSCTSFEVSRTSQNCDVGLRVSGKAM